MKFKVIMLILLLCFITLYGVSYAEETQEETNTDPGKYDKIVEDLKSEDESVRDSAIDELLEEVLDSLQIIVDRADVDKTGNLGDEHEQRIRSLMRDTLVQVSEKPKENIKETFKGVLDNKETRELIAPFMGVFLEIMQVELDKQVDKATQTDDTSTDNSSTEEDNTDSQQ